MVICLFWATTCYFFDAALLPPHSGACRHSKFRPEELEGLPESRIPRARSSPGLTAPLPLPVHVFLTLTLPNLLFFSPSYCLHRSCSFGCAAVHRRLLLSCPDSLSAPRRNIDCAIALHVYFARFAFSCSHGLPARTVLLVLFTSVPTRSVALPFGPSSPPTKKIKCPNEHHPCIILDWALSACIY